MYYPYIKRFLDIVLSLIAIVVFSPIMIVITIVSTIVLKGNPFFVQPRVGYKEKVFNLYKFRSMSNEKDKYGNFLPSEDRLTSYGRQLRRSSLDELPSLFNILKGDLSIIGPRPLLVKYLPYYTELEHTRHNVLPGLTGLAQVNGREYISWEKVFEYDVFYKDNVSFKLDLKIFIKTIGKVMRRADIPDVVDSTEDSKGNKLRDSLDKERRINGLGSWK